MRAMRHAKSREVYRQVSLYVAPASLPVWQAAIEHVERVRAERPDYSLSRFVTEAIVHELAGREQT